MSVLYVSTRYAGSGFTSKLFNDYKGFNEERKNNAQLKNSFLTLDDLNQVESIFEENPNNDFFVIGIDEFSCEKDCSTSAITEIASTLNHEEFHGERLLLGFPKHGATDHLLYYNLEEHDSPDDKDVLTLPVHKGSDAFINLHQIINYFLGNEN